MDQKLTVYQSINDFRKKTFNIDTLGSTIFQELKRYNHSLDLVLSKATQTRSTITVDALFEELDELLGNKFLGLRVYLQQLEDNRILKHNTTSRDAVVCIDHRPFQLFDNYLKSAIERSDYYIFSHSSLAIIRRLLQVPDLERMKTSHLIDKVIADKIPLQDEALDELVQRGVLIEVEHRYCITLLAKNLAVLCTAQTIIKAFDRSRITFE
jgi:hypothetical protein